MIWPEQHVDRSSIKELLRDAVVDGCSLRAPPIACRLLELSLSRRGSTCRSAKARTVPSWKVQRRNVTSTTYLGCPQARRGTIMSRLPRMALKSLAACISSVGEMQPRPGSLFHRAAAYTDGAAMACGLAGRRAGATSRRYRIQKALIRWRIAMTDRKVWLRRWQKCRPELGKRCVPRKDGRSEEDEVRRGIWSV